MMRIFARIAFLSLICLAFAITRAGGEQSAPTHQDPAGQDQAQPPAHNPPHVDAQTNPDDRKLEQQIKGELQQDPHMAYSRVRVHVTDSEVQLSGIVLTTEAKDWASKIATEHSGGRKITNHIKVNPNTHPGSGL
jgi:osmotically-inducible protein OsmY